MESSIRTAEKLAFARDGFLVLRRAFDANALRSEVYAALETGTVRPIDTDLVRVRYVPMMVGHTPTSLVLLDQLEAVASALLGCEVVPLRAKGVRYFGNTVWHRDSDLELPSVGFLAYLERLGAKTGALRLLPGSHRNPFAPALVGLSISTDPGDVIVFDEHLLHASSGGGIRTQWRVDYFARPRSTQETARTREYVGRVFPPDWDGGYDVDRFPTYGRDWLESGRPAVAHLGELGVYELAAVQERFTRRRAQGTRFP
jgi:hypothetical protein